MFDGASRSTDDDKRLLRSLKRTQVTIALAYLYDCLMLFGYSAAGFIDARIPLVVFLLVAALVAATYLAHASGWSLRRKDPSLFLPQQLYANAVALGTAFVAPQIGFQPLATLFAISAFSFLAPNAKSLIISGVAASLGTAAVILIVGPQLAMPTSTLAGQLLTCGVMIGLLARCAWIATFFGKLQHRVNDKNKALTAAVQRIEIMANSDELTGLPNRRAIMTWLDERIAACSGAALPLSVALIDIDHFKRINDAHGHIGGDRTLQIFSKLALEAIREKDRIGRYGGEEFLIVLVGTTLQGAQEPLDRLRERVSRQDWSAVDGGVSVTITGGVAEYSPGETAGELIRRADMALYRGKEAGRNRIVLESALNSSPGRRARVA